MEFKSSKVVFWYTLPKKMLEMFRGFIVRVHFHYLLSGIQTQEALGQCVNNQGRVNKDFI